MCTPQDDSMERRLLMMCYLSLLLESQDERRSWAQVPQQRYHTRPLIGQSDFRGLPNRRRWITDKCRIRSVLRVVEVRATNRSVVASVASTDSGGKTHSPSPMCCLSGLSNQRSEVSHRLGQISLSTGGVPPMWLVHHLLSPFKKKDRNWRAEITLFFVSCSSCRCIPDLPLI